VAASLFRSDQFGRPGRIGRVEAMIGKSEFRNPACRADPSGDLIEANRRGKPIRPLLNRLGCAPRRPGWRRQAAEALPLWVIRCMVALGSTQPPCR